MCLLYWKIYEMGIPVLVGPSTLAKILGCPTQCDCDVVVYKNDMEKVAERCVWAIDDPSFIHRYMWIAGLPHVSIGDIAKIEGPTETINCILDRLRGAPRVL
ncbi:MAG: hypothetical protein QW598_07245 [Pyrobaculum sp.]